jgi:hypothetical protein
MALGPTCKLSAVNKLSAGGKFDVMCDGKLSKNQNNMNNI